MVHAPTYVLCACELCECTHVSHKVLCGWRDHKMLRPIMPRAKGKWLLLAMAVAVAGFAPRPAVDCARRIAVGRTCTCVSCTCINTRVRTYAHAHIHMRPRSNACGPHCADIATMLSGITYLWQVFSRVPVCDACHPTRISRRGQGALLSASACTCTHMHLRNHVHAQSCTCACTCIRTHVCTHMHRQARPSSTRSKSMRTMTTRCMCIHVHVHVHICARA